MAVKAKAPSSLRIGLHDSGMTAVLRAGVGGLASSLRAIEDLPEQRRPPGSWQVEPHAVTLDWREPGKAGAFLEALFNESFRLTPDLGIIDLPGTYGAKRPRADVMSAMQDAYRATFLQHGKHAVKHGNSALCSFEIDERAVWFQVQAYASYKHQKAWKEIARELDKAPGRAKPIALAAWASPGAVERHVAFANSKMQYTPSQALAACFALVGCLSFRGAGGGALVIVDPGDLVEFARLRPMLTPVDVREITVGGTGDAAFAVQLALHGERASAWSDDVTGTQAFSLRATPWASQQKSRVDSITTGLFSDELLDCYDRVASTLRARVVTTKAKGDAPAASFVVPSGLRAFICDNLARGRPWYEGFADARHPTERDRRIHYFRKKDNLGALWSEEKEGLKTMLDDLTEAEAILVRSIHTALHQRFGAIAEESKDNPVARKNRWNGEHEKWRLAFAGAKTHEQVRYAFADLWSRAGRVRELQESWEHVLPLLRQEHWRAARDLALVGLASYVGRASASPEDTDIPTRA